MMILRFVTLFVLALGSSPSSTVVAWKLCLEEEGGGICPDETTCCPTEIRGVSACISLVHTDGPPGEPTGYCCKDSSTGCRFGYECAVSNNHSLSLNIRTGSKRNPGVGQGYCKATNKTHELDHLARDTPRYDLCRIPARMTEIHGFPLQTQNNSKSEEEVFHLAYYSNVGSITSKQYPTDNQKAVEKAIIIVHGSLRDAEDYFCAGLSLVEVGTNFDDTTMIIAPKFASLQDDMKEEQFLVWEDYAEAYYGFHWHIWRFGANAANAPISSYTALDSLVEFLVKDTDHFPNLQQITVAGHSAGGQMLQRWALLSNNVAWNTMDIRVVVANPRSFAYLDDRRWFAQDLEEGQKDVDDEVFRRPTPDELISTQCPWYNQWLWGLESGGQLLCPYRDNALAEVGSVREIATRYASRDVIYLSGEYDTIPQLNDRCGNTLQGGNRHERAIRFYHGLQEYFGKPIPSVHTFHTVPRSNHDHSLMFQSSIGRHAILGSPGKTLVAAAGFA